MKKEKKIDIPDFNSKPWVRFENDTIHLHSELIQHFSRVKNLSGEHIFGTERRLIVPLTFSEIAAVAELSHIADMVPDGRGFVSFELTAVARGLSLMGCPVVADDTLCIPNEMPYHEELYSVIFQGKK